METAHTQRARLPYRLPPDTPADRIEEIRRRIDELGDAAPLTARGEGAHETA
jgi:hypothetical protein